MTRDVLIYLISIKSYHNKKWEVELFGIDESSFKYVLKYVFAKYVFTLQLSYPYLT